MSNIKNNPYGFLIKKLICMMMVMIMVMSFGSVAFGTERKPEAEKKANPPIDFPVLQYHAFSQEPTDNSMEVTIAQFEKDLNSIKGKGYTTILPKDYVAYLEGEKTLPNKPLMITIDDGYLDNYTLAYPLLKKYNMKATIFIIGWSIGKDSLDSGIPMRPKFSWKQAKEMVDSGLISIQPHSYDMHRMENKQMNFEGGVLPFFKEDTTLYAVRFLKDLKNVTNVIEKHTGDKVVSYAYPYGRYTQELYSLFEKASNVTIAFTGEHYNAIPQGPKRNLNYEIRRTIVTPQVNINGCI